MLAIYLNDHLAGATGGVELARRAASAQQNTADGPALRRLAEDIAEDRESLLAVMRALDVGVQHYKVGAGWLAEKVGRLKLNGSWVSRSPLSSLIELEGLVIGVNGKACLWRTLRALADDEPRLDPGELDRLLSRAEAQLAVLEEMRLRTSTDVLA
jgi:hypothetical protein